ncbi:hypothetical protein DHEL01_v209798 [Diaporthe helianthi]|uniref:Uncharacterized protein n=1 Tax=Diaporthe helianthi TaxID=158607 RepID=A0A2P5HNH3_DIAHE|nr:hypothetical protein DHEL01_v209798 [Diaporthe helianthi]
MQRGHEMDPGPLPSYDEAVNSATLSRTQDTPPASQSAPHPPRYSSRPSESRSHPNDHSSRTICPQAADSKDPQLTPQERSRTTAQREPERQNLTRTTPDSLKKPGEPKPPVEAARPSADFLRRHRERVTQPTGGRSKYDDCLSDNRLSRRRAMEDQPDRIKTLKNTVEHQSAIISMLYRKVDNREKTIHENNARLEHLSAQLKKTEALLENERKGTRPAVIPIAAAAASIPSLHTAPASAILALVAAATTPSIRLLSSFFFSCSLLNLSLSSSLSLSLSASALASSCSSRQGSPSQRADPTATPRTNSPTSRAAILFFFLFVFVFVFVVVVGVVVLVVVLFAVFEDA